MKDYHVEIKVKNNLLYQAMIENGINNAAELSRLVGLCPGNCGDALNLKIPLYTKSGEVRTIWRQLSKVLHRLPEDLIPKTHWHEGMKKNTGTFEAPLDDLTYLTGPKAPDQLVFEGEKQDAVNQLIKTLKPREELAIRMRYGLGGEAPKTYQEIADHFKVTLERARQIEQKAFRKLQHSTRSQTVRHYKGDINAN